MGLGQDEIGFTVLDLLKIEVKEHNSLDLRCVAGRRGLSRSIVMPDINRPMGALMGYFDGFAAPRVQLFGQGESSFLAGLCAGDDMKAVRDLLKKEIPCCIFTHGLEPGRQFLDIAEENNCPVLFTELTTSDLISRLTRVLTEIFCPHESMHGVLVEVFGMGILLLGESGVGKSETALELIHRGHRLVADDTVDIHCVNGNILMGMGRNRLLGHHMEIRGLGVINITRMFGVKAIRDRIEIQLVVELENWKAEKSYDRIGMEQICMELLGVKVPKVEIPVMPGRNIPILVETAAMNEKLKSMGYHAAREFNRNVLKWNEMDTVNTGGFHNEGGLL